MSTEDIGHWELPPRIIRAATEANLRSCHSILTLSVGDIQRKTNLSLSDSKLLTMIASKKVLGTGTLCHSALQLLRRENCSPTVTRKVISCGCPLLDRFLRGGILVPGLTEIVGESSSGKTQFCLQLCLAVQLPSKLGGLHGGAVYICTEGSFPTKRLHQMIPFFENRLAEHQLDPIVFSDNVYIEHAMTIEELQDIMEDTLPKLLSRGNIRLVIIDSIAALFRSEFDFKEAAQRATRLHKFGRQLIRYGSEYDAGFVCVNQVSDSMNSRTFDIQQGERNIVRSVIPALGLAWSNVVNIRLILSRCEYLYNTVMNDVNAESNESHSDLVSQFPVIRKIKVLLAPHLRTSESYFLVDGLGIKGIENVTTFIASQMPKLKSDYGTRNPAVQIHQ